MNKAIEETKNQIIIPENEIIDYLISKGYVKNDWYEQISSNAMDLEELLKELKESYFDLIHQKYKDYGINYYDLLSIIQALKQLDSADKTLFGKYNSERVNKSLNIKSAWEDNNSWIAETSRIYNSCHQFQLSNLKKEEKSISEYIGSIERSNDTFEKENQKLVNEWKSIISNDDILNKNIKTNSNSVDIVSKESYLSYYSNYLDSLSTQIINNIKTNEIEEAIQYYKTMEILTLKENIEDVDDTDINDTNSLAHLNYFITKGNTNVNDYKSFFNLSKVSENTVKSSTKSEKDSCIFYNNEIRNIILSEVKQLYFFILQRYQELANYSNTNLIASYILQHSQVIIRKQTTKSLLNVINQLKDIVQKFEEFNEIWLKAYSKGYQFETLENLNSKVNQIHYQEEKIKKNKQRITELKNRLEAKTEEINNVQTYTDDLKSNLEKSLSKILRKTAIIKDFQ
ncbi:hypothetical protein H8356DRAFT_1725730 [Neocallimastix lanati (nom. inval.)]|uniref:Uncharacterized protein n=1 Tax=Neocallimastix californiae TaxID=1754190 RepID=A0A1Y2EN84_9FUNG|nr:hypothetical protein H8356DRAFT_1725730 [Neocallimastix sp. JGI-2020a]ORY73007.1 hypothetical protein LY90DRAFT_666849 [Neocallimastix californiae]|eukprot:ORY73007.1 hypothetical protein LY90DRAFT_666849 [Neocallimastix californiae]